MHHGLVLPDEGSGGWQRGLGGHGNFAGRDLEKNGQGCAAVRPIFLADRPISPLIEAPLSPAKHQGLPKKDSLLFIFGISASGGATQPPPVQPTKKVIFQIRNFYIYGDVGYRGTQQGTSNRLLFSNRARFRRERATSIPSIWVLLTAHTQHTQPALRNGLMAHGPCLALAPGIPESNS